jgi:hypothetical protein
MQSESTENRKIRFETKTVLDGSVTAINFVMTSTVNSGIFSAVCKKIGSDNRQVLLNTLVCFLSWETVLTSPF